MEDDQQHEGRGQPGVHVGAPKNHFRAQVTAAATGITHGKGRTAFPAYTRAMKQSPAKTPCPAASGQLAASRNHLSIQAATAATGTNSGHQLAYCLAINSW